MLLDVNTFKSELWSNLYEVKIGLRKMVEPVLQSEGLSMVQAYILLRLSEGDIANISSLCKDIGINQGNVSSMCKLMEKTGLILRRRSQEDERIVTLSITEHGKQKIERMKSRTNELDKILSQVSEEKLLTIIKGMHEFNELIKIITTKGR